MVDQPEGRPKSPGPGKVKPVTKKHSVSKPYERPSSSRVMTFSPILKFVDEDLNVICFFFTKFVFS